MNTNTFPVRIAVLATLCAAGVASADIVVNPSFESTSPNFAGWTTTGTVALSTAAPAAPTDGDRAALLTAGPTSAAAIATFLNCTTASLMLEANTTTAVRNGAAIKQTFTVEAGDILLFDFAFNNAEDTNNQEWPDTAFVTINGEVHALASSATTDHGWTGQQRFSKGDLPVGEITVGFAVCNFADFALNSQLMVDNVMVMRNVVIVTCGPADVGGQGGVEGFDGHLDNNDFIVFIDLFFRHDDRADLGSQGGAAGADGTFDNNDFVTFIDAFFTRLSEGGCDGGH
jgi:hypothetical protein